MENVNEPKEAFPYKPPTAEIIRQFGYIFEISEPLPARFFKLLFDKIVAIIMIFVAIPILILLKIAYLIEGLIIPEIKDQ